MLSLVYTISCLKKNMFYPVFIVISSKLTDKRFTRTTKCPNGREKSKENNANELSQ